MGSYAAGSLLGQLFPVNTNIQPVLTSVKIRTEITLVMVAIDATGFIELYHAANSGSLVAANRLMTLQKALATGDPVVFQAQGPGTGIMLEAGDSFGIRTTVASSMVVSVYGVTQSLAERVR